MRDIYIVAVGMIPFGRHYTKGHKDLVAWALSDLFSKSPVGREQIQAAWFSNTAWGGTPYDQTSIRGQVALQPSGFGEIPIMNVENACASGSCAIYGAYQGIAAGMYDVAMAVGMDKMSTPKTMENSWEGFQKEIRRRVISEGMTEEALIEKYTKAVLQGFLSGADVEVMRERIDAIKAEAERMRQEMEKQSGQQKKARENRSAFMDFYSMGARHHAKLYGSTQKQLAIIAAKTHNNGALNPYAQYRFTTTPEEVMNDDMVSYPLTRAMCAPLGDGAAAAILVSGDYLKKLGNVRPVKVRATVLGSASINGPGEERAANLARQAYAMAGVGPEDINLAEVHDATSFGEMIQVENLGFCKRGEGGILAESGATAIGGKIPINTSGGLISRGHPIGATGLAMLAECFWQLRGEAGKRQVKGARLAMTENGGGFIALGEAAIVMNIFEGPGA